PPQSTLGPPVRSLVVPAGRSLTCPTTTEQEPDPPGSVHRHVHDRQPYPRRKTVPTASHDRTQRDQHRVTPRQHERGRESRDSRREATDESQHCGRRSQVPETDSVRVLTDHSAPPLARPEILPGQATQIAPRPIGPPHSRREPHGSAAATDSVVHLPILRTMQRLVVTLDAIQRRTTECSEIHGVNRARLTTEMEPGTTD